MIGNKRSEIVWHAVKEFGNPEFDGLYLVTTKATGRVAQRSYNSYKDRWSFGEPLAWAYMPKAYSEDETK